MFRPADLPPRDLRHFYRRAALAPLCLLLVAGLHAVRVWTCRQTPWKGGGFGMFSTVDDESARYVRCYLVTDDGDLPLPIPPAAAKAVAELRAAPTQSKLDELARRFAAQSWRWRGERLIGEAAAIRQCPGDLEPIPRDEPDDGAIPFTAVRIECLRYAYNQSSQTLRARAILMAEATP